MKKYPPNNILPSLCCAIDGLKLEYVLLKGLTLSFVAVFTVKYATLLVTAPLELLTITSI